MIPPMASTSATVESAKPAQNDVGSGACTPGKTGSSHLVMNWIDLNGSSSRPPKMLHAASTTSGPVMSGGDSWGVPPCASCAATATDAGSSTCDTTLTGSS